jgi:arginine deiminase
MELIAVSDREQQKLGLQLGLPGTQCLIHYDLALSLKTQNILSRRGAEIIEFHPEALLAGGGSLHCLTMRVWRA